MNGKVYLVGAGPGDPELLTRKALRALESADLVLHDDLVTPEILALVPSMCRLYNVGKRCGRKSFTQEEINAWMIAAASEGLAVVRLKGGDPLIFGRAAEEMEALRVAGIEFEVVPGVTAALAAAASAQISLTDRKSASKLLFITGHRCAGNAQTDWTAEVTPDTTLVLYMPGERLLCIAEELRGAGLGSETPCLIISRVSTSQELTCRTTLGQLREALRLPSPSIVIIGAVAALGRLPEQPQMASFSYSSMVANALP
jgi:uroporphyrin-III C-methyltransferase